MHETRDGSLTAMIALGTLGWAVWGIWHIARQKPTRQRALTHVLAIMAGTILLGVILPAALMGIIDPLLVWIVYAVLAVGAAVVLGWQWLALEPGKGKHPSLVITSCILLAVLATATFAVT
ncbi:MAG TPA: hypothetical protein VFN21_04075 [Acidimicrobiales bacterium]|nr:hypothetical protein [Acidimicrobiales bacterium]